MKLIFLLFLTYTFPLFAMDASISIGDQQNAINAWLSPLVGKYQFNGNVEFCSSLVVESSGVGGNYKLNSYNSAIDGWYFTMIWKPNYVVVTPDKFIYETNDVYGSTIPDEDELDRYCKSFEIKYRIEMNKDNSGRLHSVKIVKFYKYYWGGFCPSRALKEADFLPYKWKVYRSWECATN